VTFHHINLFPAPWNWQVLLSKGSCNRGEQFHVFLSFIFRPGVQVAWRVWETCEKPVWTGKTA